jgi:hypothetical protein
MSDWRDVSSWRRDYHTDDNVGNKSGDTVIIAPAMPIGQQTCSQQQLSDNQ